MCPIFDRPDRWKWRSAARVAAGKPNFPWRGPKGLYYTSIMRSFRESLMARGSRPWRVILCLAVAAMLFKALIPPGYMPDAQAARAGKLLLSLCLPGGQAISMPLALEAADGAHTPDEASTQQECPFVLAAAPAMLPELAAPAMHAPALGAEEPRPLYRTLPPLPALGPPLGSRAPPSHLA
ncbi:MAG: DUF2946 domain-containing protein [Pigmentiphaga sp.]|nr:DUF2946 domain-containing protein [Pigmentiphaga sp.]